MKNGAPRETRTPDTLITNQLLSILVVSKDLAFGLYFMGILGLSYSSITRYSSLSPVILSR